MAENHDHDEAMLRARLALSYETVGWRLGLGNQPNVLVHCSCVKSIAGLMRLIPWVTLHGSAECHNMSGIIVLSAGH
jgi:hypothetical protein